MSFFSGQKLQPQQAPPMFPSLQQQFGNWLLGNVGKGVPGYKGQINENPNQTDLGGSGGTFAQAKSLQDPSQLWQTLSGGGMGNALVNGNPQSMNLAMSWGGQTGLPLQQEQTLAKYGNVDPSGAIGRGLASQMNYGVASPGSGRSLQNWGAITPQMAASFLMPFAMGQNPAAYQAPRIG